MLSDNVVFNANGLFTVYSTVIQSTYNKSMHTGHSVVHSADCIHSVLYSGVTRRCTPSSPPPPSSPVVVLNFSFIFLLLPPSPQLSIRFYFFLFSTLCHYSLLSSFLSLLLSLPPPLSSFLPSSPHILSLGFVFSLLLS